MTKKARFVPAWAAGSPNKATFAPAWKEDAATATYALTSATYVPGSLTSTSVTPRIVRTKA